VSFYFALDPMRVYVQINQKDRIARAHKIQRKIKAH